MKLFALIGAVILSMLASTGRAQVFELVHPDVEKGGFEVEFLNGFVLDSVERDDAQTAHEIAIGYAPVSFWKSTVAAEFVNAKGSGIEYEAFEWENVVVFSLGHGDAGEEEHEDFVFGVYAKLEVPNDGGFDQGAVEIGPIAEVNLGPATIIGNLFIDFPFEGSVDPGLAYALGVSAEVAGPFSAGIEAFGSIEEAFDDAPPTDEQEHYIGPAVYYEAELGNGVVLEPRLAVLFGLTDAAADAVLSINFELKF